MPKAKGQETMEEMRTRIRGAVKHSLGKDPEATRQKRPEYYAEADRKWREANPDKVKAYSLKASKLRRLKRGR